MRRKIIISLFVTGVTALVSFEALAWAGSAGSASAPPPDAVDTTLGPGQTYHAHLQQIVDGQQWQLTTFTNEYGQLCAGEKVPNDGGDGGQGATCRNPNTLLANGQLFFSVGARTVSSQNTQWSNVWVWGWTAPTVAELDLQLSDCSTVPLQIDSDHMFFKVLGANVTHAGVLPNRLVAYDASGAVLSEVDAAHVPTTPLPGSTTPPAVACR